MADYFSNKINNPYISQGRLIDSHRSGNLLDLAFGKLGRYLNVGSEHIGTNNVYDTSVYEGAADSEYNYSKMKAEYEKIKNKQNKTNDWRSTITYDKYNEEYEKAYIREHDYLGLSDYMSHFRSENPYKQKEYEAKISQIERYGRQYNALLNHATDKQKDAINFLESFNKNDLKNIGDNEFANKYREALSTIGSTPWYTPDEQASDIVVTFNDKHVSYGLFGYGPDWLSSDDDINQFSDFMDKSGYDESSIKNILGENNISVKNGKYVLKINMSNDNAVKLLCDIDQWKWDNDKVYGRGEDQDVMYRAFTPTGDDISYNDFTINTGVSSIRKIINDANKENDDALNNIPAGKEQVMSTLVLPYMNERQKYLMDLRNSNQITEAQYAAAIKNDNDFYKNDLLSQPFENLEFYSDYYNEDNKDLLFVDNVQRSNMKDYIVGAISEDRASWRAGMLNGEYGTYLVISPVRNKEEIEYSGDGDARKGTTIFIPGLYTNSVQSAFDNTTEGKTVSEYNSMQMYGYDYELPGGRKLTSAGNNGAVVKNADGTLQPVNRDEAFNLLQAAITVKDGARAIYYDGTNPDGSEKKGYNFEENASKLAAAFVNQMYPDENVLTSQSLNNPKDSDNEFIKYKRKEATQLKADIMSKIYSLLGKK